MDKIGTGKARRKGDGEGVELVKVIRVERRASEVQFNLPVRVVVPADAVDGSKVPAESLIDGAPSQDALLLDGYVPTLTAEEFIAAFRQQGLWTPEDFTDLKAVRKAINSVSRKIYGAVIEAKNMEGKK